MNREVNSDFNELIGQERLDIILEAKKKERNEKIQLRQKAKVKRYIFPSKVYFEIDYSNGWPCGGECPFGGAVDSNGTHWQGACIGAGACINCINYRGDRYEWKEDKKGKYILCNRKNILYNEKIKE
jgi:hypothetical protein